MTLSNQAHGFFGVDPHILRVETPGSHEFNLLGPCWTNSSLAQSRPFDLLVSVMRSILSHAPKR